MNTDVTMWLAELQNTLPDVHAASPSNVAATEIKKVKKKKKRQASTLSGPKKISIDFYKVDLHNVFRLLGQVSGKNIVVDESVQGTLTLALQDVPWTFVLQIIKNLKGLASQEVNNTIMIYPADKKMDWEAGVADADSGLDFEPVATNSGKDGGLVIDNPFQESGAKKRPSSIPPAQLDMATQLIEKAEKAEKKGNLAKAAHLLEKAVSIWPDNTELLKKAAVVSLKNDDELNGYNFARKVLEIEPDDSAAATIAAVALARMNKPGEAQTYFEKALSGNNPDLETLWNYAVFLFSHNDFRNALRLITRIESNYSLSPDLMMMKARSYESLNQTARAINEYRSIITAGRQIPPDMLEFAKSRLAALQAKPSASSDVVRY